MCIHFTYSQKKIVKVCSNVGSIHVDIELELDLISCRICPAYMWLGLSCVLPERKKTGAGGGGGLVPLMRERNNIKTICVIIKQI